MDFHSITIGLLATVIAILIGFKTDNIFIKRAKNNKPYLTPVGVFIFGKNKGKKSEFISPIKAVWIKAVDIVIALIFGFIIYEFSIWIIAKTYAFYAPLLIISFTSLYLTIRSGFGKIKLKESIWITLSYLIGFGLMALILYIKLS
jgi:hypothetical protein